MRLGATDRSVRAALDRLCDRLDGAGVEPELIDLSRIVLAEVLNNIVEHAYGPDRDGAIDLSVQMIPKGVRCCVMDDGAPMPDGDVPHTERPVADAGAPMTWPEGGFGWHLVRDLTSQLCYRRGAGRNDLTFEITLP